MLKNKKKNTINKFKCNKQIKTLYRSGIGWRKTHSWEWSYNKQIIKTFLECNWKVIMQVIIKCGNLTKNITEKSTITIGSADSNDFIVEGLGDSVLKMVYSSKYNNYVLVNSSNDKGILFNWSKHSCVL